MKRSRSCRNTWTSRSTSASRGSSAKRAYCTLGFTASILIGLANYSGYEQILGIIIVFAVVQILESLIITPKFVGDKVGLSSLATMLALIIGGNLLGLPGMLMAIPVAAIAKSILVDLKNEYHQLDIYKT